MKGSAPLNWDVAIVLNKLMCFCGLDFIAGGQENAQGAESVFSAHCVAEVLTKHWLPSTKRNEQRKRWEWQLFERSNIATFFWSRLLGCRNKGCRFWCLYRLFVRVPVYLLTKKQTFIKQFLMKIEKEDDGWYAWIRTLSLPVLATNFAAKARDR